MVGAEMLTKEHKINRAYCAWEFHELKGDKFLYSTMKTMYETWVAYYTLESKKQSIQCLHTGSLLAKN